MATYEIETEDGGKYQVETEEAPAPSSPSFMDTLSSDLGDVWNGVKKVPGGLLQMAKDVPTGISNLYHLPGDLKNAVSDATSMGMNRAFGTEQKSFGTNYPRAIRTLTGVGDVAAPLIGAVGGPAGMSATSKGFHKALQAVGAEEPTTLDQDLTDFREGIGAFGALGLGGKAIAAPLEIAAKKLPLKKLANQIDRSSMGAKASDYGKNSDLRTIEAPDGVYSSPTKVILDKLLEKDGIGKSRDPSKMLEVIDAKAKPIANKLNKLIDDYKEPVKVEFPETLDFLVKGKVEANKVTEYLNELDDLGSAIAKEGKGSLRYIQEQKKVKGKKWDPKDEVRSNFDRAIYNDLKKTVEKYVPEAKKLNEELQPYQIAEKIARRSLNAAENKNPIEAIAKAGFTTGGYTGSALGGQAMLGPIGAPLGVGAMFLARRLNSPDGRAMLARGLRGVEGAVDPVVAGLRSPGKLRSLAARSETRPSREYDELIARLTGR